MNEKPRVLSGVPRCPTCKTPMLSEPGKPRFCIRCATRNAAKSAVAPDDRFKEMQAVADEFARVVNATATERKSARHRWSEAIERGLRELGI